MQEALALSSSVRLTSQQNSTDFPGCCDRTKIWIKLTRWGAKIVPVLALRCRRMGNCDYTARLTHAQKEIQDNK